MNSDLLTNIDFEDLYNFYSNQDCAMCVASIPYSVNIPYAVLQTENNEVVSFAEKPKYTYYSNAGVYIMHSEIKNKIPKHTFYNATDLMENLIQNKLSIKHYPILGYWLDIGRHDDYNKAQEDIKHIKF
jgi:NDP-sugar pyrophosphorylase family protein